MKKDMQYNKCETCLAAGGRAGILFGIGNNPMECENCKETRRTGNLVIYANLSRTDEEIARTAAILTPPVIKEYFERVQNVSKEYFKTLDKEEFIMMNKIYKEGVDGLQDEGEIVRCRKLIEWMDEYFHERWYS